MAQTDLRRPLFHIGLHKTATSYLQKSVFSDAAVFAQPWGKQPALAVEHLLLRHPMQFDPAAMRAELALAMQGMENRVPIISHEKLSGDPINGQYHLEKVAGRIHAAFPEARIMIGIREQRSMLKSVYFQYVKQGGASQLRDLITINRNRPGYRPVLRMDHFEYDLTIAHYAGLFGAENVLVLPIELLNRDAEDYVAQLSGFLELGQPPVMPSPAVNARRSDRAMQLERVVNRLLPVPAQRAERYRDNPIWFRARQRGLHLSDKLLQKIGDGSRTGLATEIEHLVGERFHASNARTAALTGLDLKALGYQTAP